MDVCVWHECRCPQSPKEGIESSRAGVRDSCGSPNMGSGDQTWVSYKSSVSSYTLSRLSGCTSFNSCVGLCNHHSGVTKQHIASENSVVLSASNLPNAQLVLGSHILIIQTIGFWAWCLSLSAVALRLLQGIACHHGLVFLFNHRAESHGMDMTQFWLLLAVEHFPFGFQFGTVFDSYSVCFCVDLEMKTSLWGRVARWLLWVRPQSWLVHHPYRYDSLTLCQILFVVQVS